MALPNRNAGTGPCGAAPFTASTALPIQTTGWTLAGGSGKRRSSPTANRRARASRTRPSHHIENMDNEMIGQAQTEGARGELGGGTPVAAGEVVGRHSRLAMEITPPAHRAALTAPYSVSVYPITRSETGHPWTVLASWSSLWSAYLRNIACANSPSYFPSRTVPQPFSKVNLPAGPDVKVMFRPASWLPHLCRRPPPPGSIRAQPVRSQTSPRLHQRCRPTSTLGATRVS